MSSKLKKKEVCTINVTISKDCYKTLKKLSVDKECNTTEIAKEILEKFSNNKKNTKSNLVDINVIEEAV